MKKLFALVAGLLLTLCLTITAWADYDYIDRYDVSVTPNTDDGSLRISVQLQWTALEELPYGQELKIGIPNGSIPEVTALTDNIERLDNDNSYMYVYLTRAYAAGETFTFSYAWVQEYMYSLENGAVSYSYTPGWFDEARIGEMTLTWNDPVGVTGRGNSSGGTESQTDSTLILTASDLDYGAKMRVTRVYDNWPVPLDPSYSTGNTPADYNGGYYDDYDPTYGQRANAELIGLVTVIVLILLICLLIHTRSDGYAGGFGTRYVFVNHLWYPAGPDGRPRPGSVGTKTRPRPPRSGGFGGGSRGGGFGGGGFGGGGFGGGGHCACASSCACACACACAGGGRAGCSAKNLYGAVKLSPSAARHLTEQ